jgi:hypothetical protein
MVNFTHIVMSGSAPSILYLSVIIDLNNTSRIGTIIATLEYDPNEKSIPLDRTNHPGELYRFSKISSEIRKGGISGCRKNLRITERFFDNRYEYNQKDRWT